jgi:hypothetical protein
MTQTYNLDHRHHRHQIPINVSMAIVRFLNKRLTNDKKDTSKGCPGTALLRDSISMVSNKTAVDLILCKYDRDLVRVMTEMYKLGSLRSFGAYPSQPYRPRELRIIMSFS